MTKASFQKIIRKWHRWLGVFFGVQFLFWTIGGIYFSWTNIRHIKGDDIKKEPTAIQIQTLFIHPNEAIKKVQVDSNKLHVEQMQFVSVVDSVYYQLHYNDGIQKKVALVNAITGILKPSLSEKEAVAVAINSIKYKTQLKEVTYITSVSGHHEYRNKPLPAYAVTLTGEVNTTVYVAAALGTVQTYRNNQWRIYDFFWMLHTMDFAERTSFNNWVLRIFSVAGLFAILSGFIVFFTSRKKRKLNNKLLL